ncbi:acyl-CoA dehydrogenase [Gordonia phthalatica]|uniref:Acyl-CoA dehydrogenase n=2 Tax=Gordonia phthalatica TaxID=1136941 RepID=A0A0N9N5E9_9ACTN|nr:acyl-CoA dehydrogenase [Gordonia phthalatica]ALG86081.1 acyl-CoA dehydrogenase [Gordonia phthalatica]
MELFNPTTSEFAEFDARTRELLRATVEYFEGRGKNQLLADHRDRVWYADFLDFVKREKVFATFLTPAALAEGNPDKRWDTARIARMSQILGFYGMEYWYVWQVTVLGLAPIWQSRNEVARRRAANLLDSGGIFAFGLSEQAHGADVYSTDMLLTPRAAGGFVANGSKYYIGNGNAAAMVSTFGRRTDASVVDVSAALGRISDDEYAGYLFFAADPTADGYRLRKNVVDSQMYVAAFDLEDYPVDDDAVLHTGREAFDAAMNTVNVGKFNLGFGAIGACEHAMYEAIDHADRRILFGQRVTEFPQVQSLVTDSFGRLAAMKLYSERAVDYMRSAHAGDRRYLLVSAIEKMTVTRQGQRIYEDLADVIAARGFENDMYFPNGMQAMLGLPRLEGTVHVNMALALKFMPNYMFHPTDAGLAALRSVPGAGRAPSAVIDPLAEALRWSGRAVAPVVPRLRSETAKTAPQDVRVRREPSDDTFLFKQGPSSRLGKIRFGRWREAFDGFAHIPNVAVFTEQAAAFQVLLATAAPTDEQQRDVDFLFAIGELFTLIPYGQLILEQADIDDADPAVVDHIFDLLVREFSRHAVTLNGKPTATPEQQTRSLNLIRRPIADPARKAAVLARARALVGAYEMAP